MASRIAELFGYSPGDPTPAARAARQNLECPFLGGTCKKTLSDGTISGACTLIPKTRGPVICCPIRLYADGYRVLRNVARTAFGKALPLTTPSRKPSKPEESVAVFGKGWSKELRLPTRGRSGAYYVDWVLAHLAPDGELIDFVAVEVQSIDTTGSYRSERGAYLKGETFEGWSTAGFNWENVNKRILPQLIYKGHVLRQEPLCQKGLFFVCPSPVYNKIRERLGGELRPYPLQPGSLTIQWYDLGTETEPGQSRELVQGGQFSTTIDQIALAFTAPSNLPPSRVYEDAIRNSLKDF